MKKLLILLCIFVMVVSCAPLMKYEPPKIERPPKIEPYVLPPDPFATLDPPKPIFLARLDSGLFKEVPKEEATIIAYVTKEHDKIVIRLQYFKELVPALVKLVNVNIDIANGYITLQVDQQLAKEVYKQLYIDMANKNIVDERWNNLEKGGYWVIILAQLIALISAL